MQRTLPLLLALSGLLLAACGQGGRELAPTAPGLDTPAAPANPQTPTPPRAEGGLRAGAAAVDASWHFGASAGQFAATGAGIDNARGFDPYVHSIRTVSYTHLTLPTKRIV